MAFNCDLVFSYSNKREYIGALNFRNVIAMQVQRVFDATLSSGSSPTGVPPLLTGVYTGVIVNGVNFGTGRILSFSHPVSADITENGRHLWKQIVNLEVTHSGDSGNLSGSSVMAAFTGIYHPQLSSLDENFSFDISPDGDYRYNHNASIKCLNMPSGAYTSGYIIARGIASGLLASTPPLGYIDAIHSGLYSGLGQRVYSETIDRLNGSVNFEEIFSIQNRDFVKHAISFDNGFVNITENGLIRHSGTSTADTVFSSNPNEITTRYNNQVAGAYTRCNSLWGTYSGVLGLDAYLHSLSTQPSQITKAFDESAQELAYTMVYTNNPSMTTSGYSIERELVYSLNNLGVTDANEQANMTAYATKSTDLRTFLASAISGEMTHSQTRLTGYWAAAASCKKITETKNLSVRGKKAGYSITYSNDPSFINDGTYLTKTLALVDNGAILMHTTYFIVGHPTPLIHNPGQTQLGNAICAISATLPKPVGYYAANPVKPAALNQMFIDSVNALLLLVSSHTPLDMFVSKVTYSYTSDVTAELTTEAQYVYARVDTM